MRRRKKPLGQFVIPLIVGGAAITAIDLARRVFRHVRLFCPSPLPMKSWDPADYGIPRQAVQDHWIETPDGELLHAWYCRSPRPIASAVYCHGNTGNLTLTADVIPHFLDAGINVLYFDYRGFGRSSGIPSINGIVADGLTAARFHDRIRPKGLPSILYGYSLGGAVAAQVIKRHPFDGLILQSTFTSLPAITRVTFPRTPMHLFAGNLFDTIGVVKRLTIPLLVVHGGSDEVVPCSMAHELFDACKGRKHIEIVEGGLHKDLYTRDCDSLVWAVNRFATELPHSTRAIPLEPVSDDDDLLNTALRYIRRRLRHRTVMPQPL
ncbi:MAG TPA: alpha/beta hydrolase [Thermoanaerobaculia bacterium]|nr:alpha/beta hydrolase [Thermoanaerobaculia bacterium]